MVNAELSEPAYSYLIAFRPDGTDELCDPENEDTPPARKRQPAYPPPTKADVRYRLSEGAGLHAFALVVSRQPLPSDRGKRILTRSSQMLAATSRPSLSAPSAIGLSCRTGMRKHLTWDAPIRPK